MNPRPVAVGLSLCILACAQTPAVVPSGSESWWRGRVFYEIFVRSFADSDGDGIGDLKGLTAHLDSLNDGDPLTHADLGVEGLWLMPIYDSPSYHGYDVVDYQQVDPDYGTLEDLDALLAAAHRRGIKVILDFVPNHTSAQHPWFVDSSSSRQSVRRNWYVWSDQNPAWRRTPDDAPLWHAANGAYFYGYFWSGMPDLNLRNPEVEEAIAQAMIFWLDRGVDGFRIDAARYLIEGGDGPYTVADQPETHALAKRLRRTLKQRFPDALLVAEAWADAATVASYFGEGEEYQLGFSFDQAEAIFSSLKKGVSSDLINSIDRTQKALPERGRSFEAPFLTNHDMQRTLRKLEGDVRKARLAAATLLALPGTPFIYYGEELGMMGGSESGDEHKRTPMRWNGHAPGFGFTAAKANWYGESKELPGTSVEEQQNDSASLRNLYQRLISLRRDTTALAAGQATWQAVEGIEGVFALLRTGDNSRALFVANFSGKPTGAFKLQVSGAPTALLEEGLTGSRKVAEDQLTIEGLAPYGFAYFAL